MYSIDERTPRMDSHTITTAASYDDSLLTSSTRALQTDHDTRALDNNARAGVRTISVTPIRNQIDLSGLDQMRKRPSEEYRFRGDYEAFRAANVAAEGHSNSTTPSTAPHGTPILPRIAPAGQTAASHVRSAANGEEPHQPYTCVTCARRKVKCDKTGPPCATCSKARQQCHYQEPPPRKRKRKVVDDLQDRLDRYEKLLQDNNILPKQDNPVSPAPLQHATDPVSGGGFATLAAAEKTGKLIKAAGKTRYVDSNIWRNLGDDLHPSSDEEDVDHYRSYHDELATELHRKTSGLPSPKTPAVAIDPASAAFFSPAATTIQNLLNIHPTYDVAMQLWKQYVQNVDPITRVLHRPTTLEMLQRAAANPSSMSKSQECLLFSVYHFAVATTDDKECEKLFGQSGRVLRRRFHDATRQCLVACHFLRTTELSVLQALILFLLASRDQYDPHTFWILTGIAVRIGQRMGLHKDGEQLGLNPFDVQMRRRVFWQLLPLDGLSGQLSGTGIAISADSWDTKQPMNLNDEDIWPGMEHTPEEKSAATDMIFCLARSEIGRFHQKVSPVLGNWGKLWETRDQPAIHAALKDLENRMEEKYIRYCDISNPTHCLTIGMARGAINGARLRIRLPRAKSEGASLAERKELLDLALKVLDHVSAIHLNSMLKRFDWHMKQFFQWDPLIWILSEACRDDAVVDPEMAWGRIEALYACRPELMAQKRSLDVALNRLVLRSWETTLVKKTMTMSEPKFIAELRFVLARKETSRQNTETPQPRVNPFDPNLDATTDIPVSNYLNTNPLFPSNMLDDMSADVDWRFWEQLMQQPESFSAQDP